MAIIKYPLCLRSPPPLLFCEMGSPLPMAPSLLFKLIGLFRSPAFYRGPWSRSASPLLFVPDPSWESPRSFLDFNAGPRCKIMFNNSCTLFFWISHFCVTGTHDYTAQSKCSYSPVTNLGYTTPSKLQNEMWIKNWFSFPIPRTVNTLRCLFSK